MATELTTSADAGLVRAIGVRQLTAAVFNYTVGSGIFALPAFAYALLDGAAPVGFVVTAAVMLLVALCIAGAGSRVAISGGPYAYAEVAFGPFAGAVTGALFVLTCTASGAAVMALFADSLAALVGVPATPAFTWPVMITLTAILAWLNVRGVRTGARAVELVTVAKLLPLLLFVIAGAFFVHPTNLQWAQAPGVRDLARTAGILVFAFAGMEAAVTPGAEVREPARTVPRAVILSLCITTALYAAIQLVAQGVLGARLADDRTTPLASAAAQFLGGAGQRLMLVGATISTLGFLAGDLLASPRILFAFGRDGLLPRSLAAVHARHRTPHVAIIAYGIIVAALALSGTFGQLAVLASLSILTLYFVVALAALVLQRRGVRTLGEPLRLPGGPAIPALAMASIAGIFVETVSTREAIGVVGVLAAGAVLHVVRARRAAPRAPIAPAAE